MGVEKISLKISNKIGDKLNKTQEEKSVLNYGLFVILHTSITIIVTLIVGVLTGTLKEMIIICTCSALLKRYSGGVHASSPMRCTIIGVSMCTVLAIATKWIANNVSGINLLMILVLGIIICYYVLYKRCPVGSKQKPLKKESKRKLLRKKSFNVMNIYSIIIFVLYKSNEIFEYKILKTICISILCGALIQIFSLSKHGGKLLVYFDNLLGRRHQEC